MDENFEIFLRERVKERGFSIKKLSELTGIASSHLENMVRGNFDDIPSAPYFHGYLIRLGKALDFDGEDWWDRVKKEGIVKNSGPADSLPRNRFVRKSPAKLVFGVVVIVLILLYLGFQLPRIWGKPDLTLSSPDQNPYTTQSNTLTMAGTVQNADSLYLNGDEVTIASGGAWQKDVLLQSGVNTFEIAAKKLLGGETDVVEQVIYQPSGLPSASSTTSTTTSTSDPNTSTSQSSGTFTGE